MAINFPNNPTLNQEFTDSNGEVWIASVVTPGAPHWKRRPLSPTLGMLGGGTTGQILTKQSSTAYDTAWETEPPGQPAGGTTGQILTKLSGTPYDVDWVTAPNELPTGGTVNQVLAKIDLDNYNTYWKTDTGGLESGTVALFPQATAPTGWVITNSFDGKMMRITDGAGGGAGGAIGGSDNPVSNSKMPMHSHASSNSDMQGTHEHGPNGGGSFYTSGGAIIHETDAPIVQGEATTTSSATSSHMHSLTIANNVGASSWSPKYVDVVAATKN